MKYISFFMLFWWGGSPLSAQAGLAAFQGKYDGGKPVGVEIAPHRYNADLSWNSNTDAFPSDLRDIMYAEAAHFKYNLGYTFFATQGGAGTPALRRSIYDAGRCEYGLYFPLLSWTDGDTATLRAQVQYLKDTLSNLNEITVVSYVNGDDGGSDTLTWLNEFLGGRNSGANPASGPGEYNSLNDFYGYSAAGDTLGRAVDSTQWRESYTISMPGVSRFNNSDGWTFGDSATTAGNATTAADYMVEIAGKRGMYDNFTHFNDLFMDGGIDYRNSYFGFLKNHRDSLDSNSLFAFSNGYGSIVEYGYARNMVDSVWAKDIGDGLIVEISYTDIPGIDRTLINQPVSVVIRLDSTNLSNLDVKCDCAGIRKIAADSISLDVSIPADLNNSVVQVGISQTGVYYDFETPAIDSVTYADGTIQVFADKPVLATVFYGPRDGNGPWDLENAIRSGTQYQTSHSIDMSAVTVATKDIYIGIITREKQSALSEVYQF